MPQHSRGTLAPRGVHLTILVLTSALCACTSYRAKPITPADTRAALAVPDGDRLHAAAAAVSHPLLAPVRFDPMQPYTADVVAILAVILNPTLRSARDQHAVQAAQVLQAGILPNPQLFVSASEPFTGDPQQTTTGFAYGFSWELTALIAHHRRLAAARTQAASVDLAIAWQEWQTALAAQQAFYRVQGATERLAIAEPLALRAEHFAISERQALSDGWVTATEVSESDVIAHDLRVQALDLAEDLDQQRSQLIRIMGLPAGAVLRLAPARWSIRAPELDVGDDALEANRLDLQALRLAYQSQEQTLHAAVLGQFPKISLQFSHQRDTGDVQSYGPGLTIDLPLFDRNQGVIANETATRQRLYDEYLQRVFDSRHDLADALQACRWAAQRIHISDGHVRELAQRSTNAHAELPRGLVTAALENAAASACDVQRLESILWRQRLAEATLGVEIVAGRYLPEPSRSGAEP